MSLPTLDRELDLIRSCVRDVPNFPKPSILFKDITPLLQNPNARLQVVTKMTNYYQAEKMM